MSDNPSAMIEYLDVSSFSSLREGLPAGAEAVLEAVNQRVAGAETLDAIMSYVFDATSGFCPCDRIGLAFGEDGNERLTTYWAKTRYEPALLKVGYSETLEGSSLQGVLREGKVRIINDLQAYSEAHPESQSTRILLREGVRSSMTCPLVVEGRRVGVMFRSSRQVGSYERSHVQMHLAIAERLGQAVEKAHRIEQLDAANKSYMEMLGFVSHELKNPLASIVMDAQMLSQGYLGEMADKQKDKVRRMIGKAEFLLNLIREYLDLSRLEGGGLVLRAKEGVDVSAELLDVTIDLLRPQIEQKKMTVSVEVDEAVGGHIECDPDLMKIVMVNLVGNAIKYGYEKGQIRVVVRPIEQGVSVSVWNEGPGFPQSEKSSLFRKFGRLQTPELLKQKGTGVGLYTTWRIIRLHGGTIRADSEEGKWAEFAFDLPQPLSLSGD